LIWPPFSEEIILKNRTSTVFNGSKNELIHAEEERHAFVISLQSNQLQVLFINVKTDLKKEWSHWIMASF
jgi:hypothetical protein